MDDLWTDAILKGAKEEVADTVSDLPFRTFSNDDELDWNFEMKETDEGEGEGEGEDFMTEDEYEESLRAIERGFE